MIFTIIAFSILILLTISEILYWELQIPNADGVLYVVIFGLQALFFLAYLGIMITLWLKLYRIGFNDRKEEILSYSLLVLGICTSVVFISRSGVFTGYSGVSGYEAYRFFTGITGGLERVSMVLSGIFLIFNSNKFRRNQLS